MENIEANNTLSEDKVPTPLTEKELLEWASIESFEKFSNYEDFIASDFFEKYYKIEKRYNKSKWLWWIEKQEQIKITKKSPSGKETVLYLWPAREWEIDSDAEKIQRMLIALGYLKRQDFDLSVERGGNSWRDETDASYWWRLWNHEGKAIKKFQSDSHVRVDGVVGRVTSYIMYRKIFDLFHRKLGSKVSSEIRKLRDAISS